MKVIISGPRDLTLSVAEMDYVVERSGFDVTHVIEGGARGVDRSAREWARRRGMGLTTVHARWAHWQERGDVGYAGRERNYNMARDYGAEAHIAVCRAGIPGTYGTSGSVMETARVKLPTYIAEV